MRKFHPLFLPVSMVVLNSLDALFTGYIVTKGVGSEANPIMGYLIDQSVWLFLFVKLIPGNLFIWWAAHYKRPLVRLVIAVFALLFLNLVVEQLLIIALAHARNLL